MSGKEELVRAYVGSASLNIDFDEALALAVEIDDAAASSLEIQAREMGIEPRNVE